MTDTAADQPGADVPGLYQPGGYPSGEFAGGLFGPAPIPPAPDSARGFGDPARPDTAVLPAARPASLVGLEASNVSAWFGGHKVLERVSLHMEPGRVTALIGPSGCGKSTFLRILNRMHEMIKGAQLAGQVLLDGQDIYDAAVRPTDVRRRIGMVFQKPNPFPAMSIYDNVASGLKLSRHQGPANGRPRRGQPAPGRPVERGATRLTLAGWRAVRRPAAAAVHRQVAGDRPGRAADGRAVLGARPHLDSPDRGDHRRDLRSGDDRHRHPQHAAGAARLRRTARSSWPPQARRATLSSRARRSRCSRTRPTRAPPTT